MQPLLQGKCNKYYILRVFVALRIQYATRMRHIVICGLPRSTIFFNTISQTDHKMFFDFLSDFRLKQFPF